MKIATVIVAVVSMAAALTLAGTSRAAPSVAEVLDANRAATGGTALASKAAAETDYAFSGMGLTGKVVSLTDVQGGRFADTAVVGPGEQANGWDGAHAWAKDMSGAVTVQDGADERAGAINESYRRANLWWRADRGGAQVAFAGEKTEGGSTYEVLTVTPKDGKPFDAWFDAKSHLLVRLVEKQGAQAITTTMSDYRPVDGVMIAYKAVVDGGGGEKYLQTLTLTGAKFLPAQDAAAYAAPKVTLTDFSIDGGAAQTVFPFKLINNHVYAEAKVNGKGPFLFIFDTGGLNLVTPATAKALGIATQGAMDARGAGEGSMEAGLTKVSELRLGQAAIKDQVFAVLPLDAMSNIEGVDETGMVGFETFRRFVTRIDYGAGTITLIDPKHFDPKDAGTPVKFNFADHNPEIEGSFEGIPGKFHIDTGSRVELTLNKPFVAAHGLIASHPKGVEGVDGWGVGGPSRAYITRGASLKLGDVEVKDVVTSLANQDKGAFAGDDYQGNIGGGVLKRFVVTFDYEHQLMYLKPIAGAVADAGTYDRAGMWVNGSDAGFKVADLIAGGPAAAAGLKLNDEIVAVDGKPATSIPLYELRKRLRTGAPGTDVALDVRRAGQPVSVKLTLKDQI